MALKFKCKSKEEIPAGLEGHYVEREGAWVLEAEGAVDKAKLDEFRSTNVALLKERDELKQRFEGIDPEEVRRLAEEKRDSIPEFIADNWLGHTSLPQKRYHPFTR